MATLVEKPHITLDGEGRAWLSGTGTKVIEIAMDHLAYGWSPAEIHFQHPHLSLGQIHAALSYYFDHEPELNREIESVSAEYKALKSKHGPSPFFERMKSEGRLA